MRCWTIFVFIALVYLLSGFLGPETAASAPGSRPVLVSGMVRWSDTRAPAAGVTVSVYSVNGDTSAPLEVTQSLVNGSFILRVPSPGVYQFVASGSAWSPKATLSLTVPASGAYGVTLLLSKRTRSGVGLSHPGVQWSVVPAMELKVTNARGKPVRRGKVDVWLVWAPRQPQDVKHFKVWSSAAGFCSEFPASSHMIKLAAPSFFYRQIPAGVGIAVRSALYGTSQIILERWPDAPVKVRLHPAPHLKGTVVDQDGKPVAGARVTVTGMARRLPFRFLQGWVWGYTGKTGKFDFPALFPGRYVVRVGKPFGRMERIRFVTIPGVGIRGGAKRPLHGASVALPIALQPRTTPVIVGIPPVYAFGLSAAQPEEWALEPGQLIHSDDPTYDSNPTNYDMALFAGATLDPRPAAAPISIMGQLVAAPAGAPLPNCTIDLYSEGQQIQGRDDFPSDVTTTEPDGSFSLSAPGPGHYHLVARQGDYLLCDHSFMLAATGKKPFILTVAPRPVAEVLVVDADDHLLNGDAIPTWVTTFHGSETRFSAPVRSTPKTLQRPIHSSSTTAPRRARGTPVKFQWPGQAAPLPGDRVVFGARSETLGVGEVEMGHWPTAPVIVRLTPGLTLRFHVLDAAGKPVVHAFITVDRGVKYGAGRWWGWEYMGTTPQTDIDGSSEIGQLLPGDYQLLVHEPGEKSFSQKVTLSAPDTTITLKPDPLPTGH